MSIWRNPTWLNQESAFIFRIVHRDNAPCLLTHGIHCQGLKKCACTYKCIGNAELITKRTTRPIPIPPGGSLSDYVPFYFTPYSPMLYNIRTGHNVAHVPNEEIVIFVSSLPRLNARSVPFIFTDRHAYLNAAQFFHDLKFLNRIKWDILQRRDFQRDPNDPAKLEGYQAEALVYQRVPIEALSNIVCYNGEVASSLQGFAVVQEAGLNIMVEPGLYFS
jgi:ssDNA thymidine ADP-ribosyltransferase, DarT